jgi:hypothetical protein
MTWNYSRVAAIRSVNVTDWDVFCTDSVSFPYSFRHVQDGDIYEEYPLEVYVTDPVSRPILIAYRDI